MANEVTSILNFKVDTKFIKDLNQELNKADEKLKAMTEQAKSTANEVDKAGKNMAGAFSSFDKVLKGVAAVGSFLAVGKGLQIIARNTMDAQNEMAALESVIRSTGGAAGFTAKQVDELSTTMSNSSIFSAGEINMAAARMLTYTDIVGNEFPRAMQTAIDWSARYGTSVTQAAETVGKALQKPSAAAAALSRQGFSFTKEFVEQLKQLERAGKLAEAQNLIFEQIEEGTKGAAEAMRNTFGGAVRGLQNQLNDLMTGKDGSLDGTAESINNLTKVLNDPAVQQGFAALISLAAQVTAAFGESVGTVASFVAEILKASSIAGKLRSGEELDSSERIGRSVQINDRLGDLKGGANHRNMDEQYRKVLLQSRQRWTAEGEMDYLRNERKELFAKERVYQTEQRALIKTNSDNLTALSNANEGQDKGALSDAQKKALSDAARQWKILTERVAAAYEELGNTAAIDSSRQAILQSGQNAEYSARMFDAAAKAATAMGASVEGGIPLLDDVGVKLQYNLDVLQKQNNLSNEQVNILRKQIDLITAKAQANERNRISDEAINSINNRITGEAEISGVGQGALKALNEGDITTTAQLTYYIQQQTAELEIQRQLKAAGLSLGDAELESLEARLRKQMEITANTNAELEVVQAILDKSKAETAEFGNFLSESFSKTFDHIWENGGKGFGNFLAKMAQDLAKSVAMKYLNELITTGQINIGGFGFANGGAFDGGGRQFFAQGGILNSATPFAMGNGKMGVAGEAGPEGILPLSRGKDGKLGVTMNGSMGGQSGPTVVISAGAVVVNASNDSQEDAQKTAAALKQVIDVQVRQILMDQNRSGNSLSSVFPQRY